MNIAGRIQNLRKMRGISQEKLAEAIGVSQQVVATGLNYIGFIIMLFDAFCTWDSRPFAMTNGMIISKILSIVFMIIGTTVFYLGLENNKYKKIRRFLMINIFSYSIIISMIVYILDFPYLWRIISYVIVVFATEVVLLKKKNWRN